MSWNVMREVSKPTRGFVFSCEAGHEWFVALDAYGTLYDEKGNHLPNNCQECADAGKSSSDAGEAA